MKLIKADHHRRIAIPGVPDLVRRPVDIDAPKTGFANLRSLRIYRFDKDSTIDGHAEEDEVFVVALAGSVELTISDDGSPEQPRTFTLSAAKDSNADPCVAYLPPLSAYRLIAKTDADIAYARATTASGHPSKVFTEHGRMDAAGITVLLEEKTYARRLRLRLVSISALQDAVAFEPVDQSEVGCEALVHVRPIPTQGAATIANREDTPILLESWDTAVVAPGDRLRLHFEIQSQALILVVLTA